MAFFFRCLIGIETYRDSNTMLQSIEKLAIFSRLLTISIGFCANLLLPNHVSDDAFKSPTNPHDSTKPGDNLIAFLFGGFRQWDSEHYLHIAEYGYIYDISLAFYPLYPLTIRYVTNFLLTVLPLDMWLSFKSASLVIALIVNIFCFAKAAKYLHRLSVEIFGKHTIANLIVFLFCFNPATIFFTAPYTESLFAWMSFWTMYNCVALCDNNDKILSIAISLSLSILCRSNGIINCGFVIFYGYKNIIYKIYHNNYTNLYLIISLLKITFLLSVAGFVFSSIQLYQFNLFCTNHNDLSIPNYLVSHSIANNYLIMGNFSHQIPKWCHNQYPFPYSFVQNHYWNVGFLKYYELKQFPQFLLAAPILYMCGKELWIYYRKNWNALIKLEFLYSTEEKIFVYMIHVTFLAIVCILFVHIQVSTRLLASASPCLYWFSAKHLIKHLNNSNSYWKNVVELIKNRNVIVLWYCLYFFVGIFSFCNGLPWT